MHFMHFGNLNQCLKNPRLLSLFNKFHDGFRPGKQETFSMTFPGRMNPVYPTLRMDVR